MEMRRSQTGPQFVLPEYTFARMTRWPKRGAADWLVNKHPKPRYNPRLCR